jgi:hypothetical protein
MHIISSKKTIVSAYFCRDGFVSIEFLPDREKYNSLLFTETILSRVEEKLAECRPKLRATAADLNVDNSRLHTSKIAIEKIEELWFIRVPHPLIHPTSHYMTSSCSVI